MAKTAPREVEFTDAAFRELKWFKVTKPEWKAIADALEAVAASANPCLHYAVTSVRCTDDEWLRLKVVDPSHWRLFFTVENDGRTILVRHAFRRFDNTYAWIEICYRVEGQIGESAEAA